jgi:cyclic pyranopterin monophosphate synthase
MKNRKLTHIDTMGNSSMVNISEKSVTRRVARAQAIINVGKEIISQIKNEDLTTKKGSVFQTAILAGVMGAKKTADLIPLCHPLSLEDCQLKVFTEGETIVLQSTAVIEGKTGVEMEALTAVAVAALTVYDMCKALSHNIVIQEIRLLEKTGGKKDFKFEPSK